MRLRHCGFRPIAHIIGKIAEIGQRTAGAVDVACALIVDQKQMLGPWAAFDIDIFAQLDRAFGAQNGGATIAPGRQAIGGKPIDANIARGAAVPQGDFAEILKAIANRIAANAGIADIGVRAIGEGQELINLVAGDIDQKATLIFRVEKPGGTQCAV